MFFPSFHERKGLPWLILPHWWKNTKAEKIEALIYVSDDVYTRLNIERAGNEQNEKVLEVVKEYVSKVNKDLQPYARISKITLLDKALEMTTTQKVKRNYNK